MINERVGMGMNMNMAHPAGKAMAVFAVLVLLSLPVLGIWLMADELAPMGTEIADNVLIHRNYRIPLDEIESVDVLETLPRASRTWGTGLPNLLKGSFVVDGYGSCTLCLNPTARPFLVLDTTGPTYILGGEELIDLYDQLQP
jgi:hypothetical protein